MDGNVVVMRGMMPQQMTQVFQQPLQGVQQQGVQQWAWVQPVQMGYYDQSFEARQNAMVSVMVQNEPMKPGFQLQQQPNESATEGGPPPPHLLTRAARRRMRQRLRKKFGKTLEEMRKEEDEASTSASAGHSEEATVEEDSQDSDSVKHEPHLMTLDVPLPLPKRKAEAASSNVEVPIITEVDARAIMDLRQLGGALTKDVPVCALQEIKPLKPLAQLEQEMALIAKKPQAKKPATSQQQVEDDNREADIPVVNTFIHFAEHVDSHASRRSRSV